MSDKVRRRSGNTFIRNQRSRFSQELEKRLALRASHSVLKRDRNLHSRCLEAAEAPTVLRRAHEELVEFPRHLFHHLDVAQVHSVFAHLLRRLERIAAHHSSPICSFHRGGDSCEEDVVDISVVVTCVVIVIRMSSSLSLLRLLLNGFFVITREAKKPSPIMWTENDVQIG